MCRHGPAIWIACLLLFLSAAPVSAQSPRYALSFSRNENAFTWGHSFNMGQTVGKRLRISGTSSMNSTLRTSKTRENQWDESNATSLSFSYPFSEGINLGVGLSMSKRYSSMSRVKRTATKSFNSSLSWRPFSSLQLSQSVGQSLDRRLGTSDAGMSYSTSATISPELPGPFTASLSFRKSGNTLKRNELNTSMSGSVRYSGSRDIQVSIPFSESRHGEKYYRTIRTDSRLLYAPPYQWVSVKEDIVEIGVTDYAQWEVGTLRSIVLPEVGDEVIRGQPFVTILGTHTADLRAPLSGEIVEVNTEVLDHLTDINRFPYQSTNWLVKMKFYYSDELETLMPPDHYEKEVAARKPLEDRFTRSRSMGTTVDLGKIMGFQVNGSVKYSNQLQEDGGNDDLGNSSKYQQNRTNQSLTLDGNVSRRRILGRFDLSYGIAYDTSTRDVDDDRRDTKEKDLSMNGNLSFGITRSDSVALRANVSKHSFDTPDPEETNDRDQFAGNLTVVYSRGFSSGLSLTVNANTSHNHKVYLSGEKSGDNQWTRTYRLKPSLGYRASDRLNFAQSYELSADYRSFDFDALLNPDRRKSTISRRVSVTNSVQWKLTDRVSANMGYTFTDEDYGTLYEENSRQVSWKRVYHGGNMSCSYRVSSSLSLSSGYGYSNRKQWDYTYEGDQEIRTSSRANALPTTNHSLTLAYNPSRTNTLTFSGRRTVMMKWKKEKNAEGTWDWRKNRDVRDVLSITYSHTF